MITLHAMSGRAAGLGLALAAAALAAPVALAHPVDYHASLSGLAEAPPNESPGVGAVLITFDDDAYTMRVRADFSGLVGETVSAHIHCCTLEPGTGSAGVVSPLPAFPGFPLGVTAGTYDQTFDLTQPSSWNPAFLATLEGSTAAAVAALATGLASDRAYFNIHSEVYPVGEIRGFLVPVPEPGTYALMAGGVALLGAVLHRRGGRPR